MFLKTELFSNSITYYVLFKSFLFVTVIAAISTVPLAVDLERKPSNVEVKMAL